MEAEVTNRETENMSMERSEPDSVGATDKTQETFPSVKTLAQLHSPSSLQQDFRELTLFFKLLKPH